MLPTSEIRARILNILRASGQPMSSPEIHRRMVGYSVTGNRVGMMLGAMVRAGEVRKHGEARYVEAEKIQMAASGVSQQMQDKLDIYAHRPLVSIPRVAPMREIPAWSRQPL